ncbi:hypothetical protein [Labilibaculum sp.]|uniref:hypothetical protein n=1 Tax=Labilibaculum sp. TaxID=2060723 RepID=UPI00356183B4
MKTKYFKLSCLFLFILFATQSCVVSSLHPLYTDSDRVHLDDLDGVWIDEDHEIIEIKTIVDSTESDKTEQFFFNPVLRKHYQITVRSKKEKNAVFDGRLSKLDGNYFLDLIPNEKFLEKNLDNINLIGLVVPMHALFKLQIKDDQLILDGIGNDVFEKLIDENKIRIDYIKRGDRIVLTSKTSDLQKFLIKFSDDKMFNDPKKALILKRIEDLDFKSE